MGYYVNLEESTAKFKVKNKNKIIVAMKEHNKNVPDWHKLQCIESNCKNIVEIFEELDFEIKKSGQYYEIICYISEKLGEQEFWFPIIAPYMEDGYIHMLGEGGEHWKWSFVNGKFKIMKARIMFDDDFHVEID